MKKSLYVILLLSVNYVFAQDTTSTAKPAQEHEPIFTIVENMPRFPGGDDSLFKFIADNIRYPEEVKNYPGKPTVYVTYVVEKDGRLSSIKVIRGLEKTLDDEALRVMALMPKWIPGTQNRKPCKVQYNLPIRFYSK